MVDVIREVMDCQQESPSHQKSKCSCSRVDNSPQQTSSGHGSVPSLVAVLLRTSTQRGRRDILYILSHVYILPQTTRIGSGITGCYYLACKTSSLSTRESPVLKWCNRSHIECSERIQPWAPVKPSLINVRRPSVHDWRNVTIASTG
jgi:hypothetical protein